MERDNSHSFGGMTTQVLIDQVVGRIKRCYDTVDTLIQPQGVLLDVLRPTGINKLRGVYPIERRRQAIDAAFYCGNPIIQAHSPDHHRNQLPDQKYPNRGRYAAYPACKYPTIALNIGHTDPLLLSWALLRSGIDDLDFIVGIEVQRGHQRR